MSIKGIDAFSDIASFLFSAGFAISTFCSVLLQETNANIIMIYFNAVRFALYCGVCMCVLPKGTFSELSAVI